jgi:nucleotide-binding universal stress UspA family protein
MAKTKNTILIPVGFSEQSMIALTQSYNLSRFTGSELLLLTVIEEQPTLIKLLGRNKEAEKGKQELVRRALESLAKEVREKSGLSVKIKICRGKVYEGIIKVANEVNPLFIIMGTSGTANGIKGRFIGTNTLRVVRETTFPVITIHGKEHRNGCKNILLPLDLSKITKEKVQNAISFARYFESKIWLLSIYPSVKDEFLYKRIERQHHQVKNAIEKQGVEVEGQLIKQKRGEDEADVVLKYADNIKADLIVIMSERESSFEEFFKTSDDTQKIIYQSEIPVLCVKPQLIKDFLVEAITPY